MKKVFTDKNTIAHLWANQVQDSARNHGNFYFEGKIIYSYGGHFPIANIYSDNAILFNNNGYSVTTGEHIRTVKNSLSYDQKQNLIYVNDPVPCFDDKISVLVYGEGEINKISKELQRQQEIIARARKKEKYIPEFKSTIENARKLIVFLESEIKRLPASWYKPETAHDIKIKKDALTVWRKRFKAAIKLLNASSDIGNLDSLKAAILKREKTLKAEKLKKQKTQIAKFRAGEAQVYIESDLSYLRIKNPIINGELFLETSRGIILSFEESRRLYMAFKANRLLGENIQHYTITSVSNNQVKAGCHIIEFNEIENAAKLIGLNN